MKDNENAKSQPCINLCHILKVKMTYGLHESGATIQFVDLQYREIHCEAPKQMSKHSTR